MNGLLLYVLKGHVVPLVKERVHYLYLFKVYFLKYTMLKYAQSTMNYIAWEVYLSTLPGMVLGPGGQIMSRLS